MTGTPGFRSTLIAAGLFLWGLGCASSGVPLEELSDEAIALVYWDEASARDNREFDSRAERDGLPQGGRRGVASVNEMMKSVDLEGDSAGGAPKRARGRIRLLNPRTLELSPFPAAPPDARPMAWSKDRKRLLFNSAHGIDGKPQLYEFNSETGEVRRLTRGPDYHLEGAYASQDRFLVTWMDLESSDDKAGLELRSFTGPGAIELTGEELPMGPQWSPKGEGVLYFVTEEKRSRRDRSQIILKAARAGAQGRVVARGRHPVFTPDGEWIIYSSETPEGWRLRRVRADGSGRSILGNSHLDARWPTVSPDGRHIAYVSNTDGIDRLYLRRIDGSGDRILLKTGAVAFPVW